MNSYVLLCYVEFLILRIMAKTLFCEVTVTLGQKIQFVVEPKWTFVLNFEEIPSVISHLTECNGRTVARY